MKKILLASAGLLALGSFGAQAAEPLKLSIGGEMKQWVGYASNKSYMNAADVDTMGDANIDFAGETTLDNGLTVGVFVETNASQDKSTHGPVGNPAVEESYLYLSGKFGHLSLGQQDNIAATVHNSAPEVSGLGAQDGDWMDFILTPAGNKATQVTYLSTEATDNISYLTPSLYGFQLGFSYVPDTKVANSGGLSIASQHNDLYAGSLVYNGELGPVGVSADFSYLVGNTTNYDVSSALPANLPNSKTYQGGLQISYADFTLGGSYMQQNVSSKAAAELGTGDSRGFDIGLSYEFEPFAVSLAYFNGKTDYAGAAGSDKVQAWNLGGSYNIGPGVDVIGSVMRAKYDSKTPNDFSSEDGITKNQGWAVVTGVRVTF